jgi:hypothetical protein
MLVLAALAVGACSGSDEAATTEPTTTSAPATTLPESTTTTEAATTTVVETTAAPPTTVDDEARLRAAEQAYIAAWEAYHAAILDPSDPDLRAAVERTNTPGAFEVASSVLDQFVVAGIVAKPHPEILAEVSVLSNAMFVPGEADLADLISCEINSEAYYEIGTAPDGSDALVRDDVFVVRSLTRIEWDGENWRLHSGETLSERVGAVGCSD